MKKQAQEQSLEGFDISFQLVPVFGSGEQHTRQKRAQRHREADEFHQQRHSHHREKRGGREDLVRAEPRHEPQRIPQKVAAAEGHQRDHAHRLGNTEPEHPAPGASGRGRQKGQEGQHRDYRDVL